MESGAALDAGILAGDIIVSFDERRVAGIADLHRFLKPETIGRAVAIGVVRDGVNRTVTLTPRANG